MCERWRLALGGLGLKVLACCEEVNRNGAIFVNRGCLWLIYIPLAQSHFVSFTCKENVSVGLEHQALFSYCPEMSRGVGSLDLRRREL